MDFNTHAKDPGSFVSDAEQKVIPRSPHRTLFPITPLGAGISLSPFTLFSEERKGLLNSVASPAMSFDDLAKIIAEEWENLSEEERTPYKKRAHEQHETVNAAMVLTKIGTPSFGQDPPSPAPLGQKIRRCLDISTPDWQSPIIQSKVVESSDFFGSDSTIDCKVVSSDLEWVPPAEEVGLAVDYSDISDMVSLVSPPANRYLPSATANFPLSRLPPTALDLPDLGRRPNGISDPPIGNGAVPGDYTSTAPRSTAGSVAVATASAAGTCSGLVSSPASPGICESEGDGSGAIREMELEIRRAVGEMVQKQDGDGDRPFKLPAGSAIVRPTLHQSARPARGRPRKAASSSQKKRKPRLTSSSSSSKRTKCSSTSSATAATTAAVTAAATAAKKKSRSRDRFRMAEYRVGKELVSQMSKTDSSRPKAPSSSYILFYKDKMASLKAAKATMSTTEVGAAMGKAWRALSDEERLPYINRAKADRKRYEGQLCAIGRNAGVAEAAVSCVDAEASSSPADASLTPTSFPTVDSR